MARTLHLAAQGAAARAEPSRPKPTLLLCGDPGGEGLTQEASKQQAAASRPSPAGRCTQVQLVGGAQRMHLSQAHLCGGNLVVTLTHWFLALDWSHGL